MKSRMPNEVYQLQPEQRRKLLQDEGLELEDIDDQVLKRLDELSENVIGQLRLPLGVVQNLIIDGQNTWCQWQPRNHL